MSRDRRRPIAFAIALTILLAATLWMHFQPPAPDPLRPVEDYSLQWWLSPVERNAFMRLPLANGEPEQIFVLPNSTHAWVGGGFSGQLLHTDDRGNTWKSFTVIGPTGSQTPSAATYTSATISLTVPDDPLRTSSSSSPPGGPFPSGKSPLPALTPPAQITDFYFADPLHGWVLDLRGEILETLDGGKSWRGQRLLDSTCFSLAISGSRLVVGCSAGISSSIDGGRTWQLVPIGHQALISALHIAADGRIWAGAEDGQIWSSLDGRKWNSAGKSDLKRPYRISFEGLHGFAENPSGIAETTDGGKTWKSFVSSVSPATVAFSRSEQRGYSRTGSDGFIALQGGVRVAADQFLPKIHALEGFGDHKHAVALGEHGQLFVTEDGRSFRRSTLPYEPVLAIHSDSRGERLWTAGSSGVLLASRDGGESWKPSASPGAQDFRAITFTEDGVKGWAVGDQRAIVRSDDGGKRWRSVQTGQQEVAFNHVIASDDGMRIRLVIRQYANTLQSSDGGRSWRLEDSQGWRAGFFPSIDDRWAIREDGSHWLIYRGYGSKPLSAVEFVGLNTVSIVAAGENAWIDGGSFPYYRSRDGGKTWQPTGARQDVVISDVRFLNAERGFAQEPFDGRKYETNDGGISWKVIDDDRFSWRVEPLIAHGDGKRLWTTSVDGVPLHSTDGGMTWLAPTYRRLPAPWYYLAFAPVAALLFVAFRKPTPIFRDERSIEDVPWNDRPVTEPSADRLGYGSLAAGIARFFGNPRTEPPLTIAVTGPWGSGKSSLMNLVAAAVKRYGYRTVWFNAWHYQSEEFLLPAVMESLRTEAVPRLWTFGGLQFRMRLLLLRGMKNWLPALVILAILATTAAYFMRDPEAFRQLISQLANLGAKKGDEFFKSAGLVLGSLFSVVVVIRSLNTFGVSGTKVAAILSGSVRLADAGGQTGFRHRFARAFGEVTQALGRNRLVLFIDDLDRCRPEHVMAVLECINFLVTSGDCFIVVGIDRERVERCVAMRFTEESKAIGADENADGRNDEVTPVRYAQLYLEKLINIEVPVPPATLDQSCDLFVDDRREADETRVRATVFGARLAAFGQAAMPWVVGLTVLAGAFHFGYVELPDRYHRHRHSESGQQQAAATSATIEVASGAASGASDLKEQAGLSFPPRFILPQVAPSQQVLPIMSILLVIAFGILRLSIERARLEHDSEDFRLALRRWHPLLYAANATPRSMKRCVNRVRYYAMRQRTNALPPNFSERLSRLALRLRGIAPPTAPNGALAIPESILVPVSVIQHLAPQFLNDDAFWRDPAAYLVLRERLPTLADGITALLEHGSIEQYRLPFAHIAAGIHMAAVADGRPKAGPA